MKERIIELASHFSDGNLAKFACSCGIVPSVLSCALYRNVFSLDIIKKILIAHKDISAEWMMRGEGLMLVTASPCAGPSKEFVMVPRQDIEYLQSMAKDSQKNAEESRRNKNAVLECIEFLQNHMAKEG